MRRFRLRTLARRINDLFSDLTTRVEEGYCNTDRKIPGTRLRSPGKGRTGNHLKVYRRSDIRNDGWSAAPVFEHNAAETYRHNGEVCRWIEGECKRRGVQCPEDIRAMGAAS